MISTNDKNLAVQMWEIIKEKIKVDPSVDVEDLKEEFCVEHKLSWHCNCILCNEYMHRDHRGCSHDCPLMQRAMSNGVCNDCGCTDTYETDYAIASNEDNGYCVKTNGGWRSYSLEERLKAIDNIINAIREVKTVDESDGRKRRKVSA